MFILELTLRSWNHSEENKRRTLQRNDIAAAITRTDIFDFLVRAPHLVPHRGCPLLLAMSSAEGDCSWVYGSYAYASWALRWSMAVQVDIVPREERDETLRPGQAMPNMPMPGPMGYWPAGQPGPMGHPGSDSAQPPLSGQVQQGQQPQQYPQVVPSMAPRPPGMQMDPSMMQVPPQNVAGSAEPVTDRSAMPLMRC